MDSKNLPNPNSRRLWAFWIGLLLVLRAGAALGALALLCSGTFEELAPRIAELPQFRTGPLKAAYFAAGNPEAPVSFSFEVEFTPDANPKLVRFYRIPEIPEARWTRMSHEERLRRFKARLAQRTKDEVVLIRREGAPRFLSPTLIRETRDSDRVELSDNAVFENLGDMFRALDWMWAEIGRGSLQGHAAFPKEGVRLAGADNATKLDFDISQAEALAYGYMNYLTLGIPPGRNLTHRSLGPLDQTSLRTMSTELRRRHLRKREGTDRRSKFVYAIVYRPELYGPQRVGFEVRNVHNRLDAFRLKMQQLAENIEDGFTPYRSPHRDARQIVLNRNVLRSLPERHQALFRKLGKHLEERHRGENVGGAPFAQRFAFPFLDWEAHPYIRVLPEADRKRFHDLLTTSRRHLEATLNRLSRSEASVGVLTDQARIAIARWGYESQLALYLRVGESLFFTP